MSQEINGEAMEAYSCSRCRKLKKKCPRQLPQCSNCVKAREVCHYPGRAPRRTKKELREAILKGEVLPSMKRKSRKIFRELTTADLRNLESWHDPMGQNMGSGTLNTPGNSNVTTNLAMSVNVVGSNMPVNSMSHNGVMPQGPYPSSTSGVIGHNAMVGTPMTTTSDPGQTQISYGTDVFGNRTAYSLIPPAQKARLVLDQNPKFVNPQSAFKANMLNVPITSPHVANQVFPEGVSSLIGTLNTMNDNLSANTPIALSYLQLQKLHQQQQQIQQQQHLQHQELQQQHLLQQQLQHVRSDLGTILPPVNTAVPPAVSNQRATSGTSGFPFTTPQPLAPTQVKHQQQQVSHSFPTSPYETKERGVYDSNVINNLQNTNSPVAKVESSSVDSDNIAIDAASIAYETISSRYNGCKSSNWVNDDGSYKTIDTSLLDKFIAAYFKHNHRLFPMIDKIFLLNDVSTIKHFEQVDRIEENNPALSKAFVFQLQMIMAIGCTTLQRAGMLSEIEENLCEHLSFLAMNKFRDVLALQNLETVKCLLLLGIYSFFEPKGVSSWTISGIVMRLVIELGLNRPLTAKKMSSMSAMDVESRYRVFWSAYCYERVVATALGRISAIDDEDVGVPLPRALYDSEIEDIEVANMIISLRKMGGKIYKEVHSVSAGRKNITMEEKQAIITSLREELDCIYKTEVEKRRVKNSTKTSKNVLSVQEFKESKIENTPSQSHNDSLVSVLSANSDTSTNAVHSKSLQVMTPNTDSPKQISYSKSPEDTTPSGNKTPAVDNTVISSTDTATSANQAAQNEVSKSPTSSIITSKLTNEKTTEDSTASPDQQISSNVNNNSAASIPKTTVSPTEVPDGTSVTVPDECASVKTTSPQTSKPTHEISFHTSDVWLAMRYSQLQILLYRPSALIPKPPLESLTILGEFCLEAWKHTYTLYKKKLLPLNWITLFRTLTICNTILYCLCQWSIDLVASAMEIQQCVEILRDFGAKWVFALKCADVFQNISNTIVDISLAHGQVPNIDKLTRELFGASDAYQDILDQNNVDVSWLDRIV
ncbi:Stb5p [Nakaseomyces bracarensis]|uniref:Stb5p n=1 Tax=Nakaseomyces bracarensis TaxID=273131 RepID=UPI00387287B8